MHPLHAILALALVSACGDDGGGSQSPDADLRPDAFVDVPDAGPKLYDQVEDYPTEDCAAGSLAGVPFLGKWHVLLDDQSDEYDVYFLEEEGQLRGILGAINATVVEATDDHLFLYRPLNMIGRGLLLCADKGGGVLRGYSARCVGLDCEVSPASAELVEPVTQ